MPENRRPAAIMFTDIVGYTVFVGKDENTAYQLLRRNRMIQKSLIKKMEVNDWKKWKVVSSPAFQPSRMLYIVR